MGLKVAVLMGGSSFEREFSLASGKQVCAALEEAGHKAVPLDTTADLVPTLRSERPDVAYVALHGKHGEDGTIQSLLEFLDIPFVGSPASVCRSTWNKDSLHTTMETYRAMTGDAPVASWPQGICIARDAFKDMGAATALDLVKDRVIGGFPVAVKPAHGGSALGVHRVDCQDDLGEAILDALSFDEHVVIEQWVEGVEMAVSVLGTGWDAYALPPVEIVAKQGLYDTAARMDVNAVDYFAPVRPSALSRRGRRERHPCRSGARRLGSVPRLRPARFGTPGRDLGRCPSPRAGDQRVARHDRAVAVPCGLQGGRAHALWRPRPPGKPVRALGNGALPAPSTGRQPNRRAMVFSCTRCVACPRLPYNGQTDKRAEGGSYGQQTRKLSWQVVWLAPSSHCCTRPVPARKRGPW